MRRLKRLISLANLTVDPSRNRGQIATFLLLGIVAVLVFAIATANLGQVSLTSLKASNAADSATLSLGSRLATNANIKWNTLGQKLEKCKATGMLGLVLAVVLAVIAVAAAVFTVGQSLWLLLAVGALAGAAGGAIGGAIAGTGALQGAIQGAIVGAAIGSAGSSVAALAAPAANAAGAAAGTSAAASSPAAGIAAPEAMMATDAIAAGASSAASTTVSGIAASAGAALSGASSLYAGSVQQQMTSDAFTVAAKALNGLPETDAIREAIFLQALGQTVNDPNRTANAKNPNDTAACYWPTPTDPIGKNVIQGDPNDVNANGNLTESIPCFEYWWDRRIAKLKEGFPQLRADVEAFFSGPMSTFETAAEATYLCSTPGANRCGDGVCDEDEQCGWASVCEQDCGACPTGGDSGPAE